jgi:hypothetical protein
MKSVSASVSSLSALSDTIIEEPGKISAEIRSTASGDNVIRSSASAAVEAAGTAGSISAF